MADTKDYPGSHLNVKAQDAYNRRKEENSLKWGKTLGSVATMLSGPSVEEKNYRAGAKGEEIVGRKLEETCRSLGGGVLHSRKPHRNAKRGDIDHIVIASGGVFIVDAKNYKQANVSVKKPRFSSKQGILFVGGKDRTHLVDGVNKQVANVEKTLAKHGWSDIPVFGVLCFVKGKELGFSGVKSLGEVQITKPSKLYKVIKAQGQLMTQEELEDLYILLASLFPAV